jgi:glycosyltransferase involved in cell wall biosynthesis
MKVAMVGPFGLSPHGTMSRRALPLGQALADRGHEVELVLPPWSCPEDSGRRWREGGVSVYNIHLPRGIPQLRHAAIVSRLVRRALEGRPDVVHCFKPKAYAGLTAAVVWCLVKLHLTDVRVVVDSDDWEGPGGWNDVGRYTWLEKRLFAWQERWGMTHCHVLTVASRTLERRALEMGLPSEAVYYLPNGVTTSDAGPNGADGARVRAQWKLADGGVLLLFTRFFEYEAGRVIDVLRKVFSEEPSAQLLLVGEGLHGEEKRFLSLAEDAGLSSHIRWAGWVDGGSLRDYFAAADVAICPLEDSLLNRARCPAKLVDLLAAGLAVVADDVGEVGGYVEHLRSGYLVSPGDDDDFAGGVLRLLREDGLRSRLGEEARRHVSERFDWSTMAAVVVRAYST